MNNWLERTELLLGSEKIEKLKFASILIVGLGGVGAYVAEMLCRAGVGKLTIADGDCVQPSNRNRQLIALISTQGIAKSEIIENRLKDINPEIQLTSIHEYLREERLVEMLESEKFDYVVDAIDTIGPKVALIKACYERNIKIVSSMGAGGKMNPSLIQISDISKSHNDYLARMIRKRLHKFKIYKGIKVVFSSELTNKEAVLLVENEENKKSTVGTISYMPALFGCFAVSVVIRDLIEI